MISAGRKMQTKEEGLRERSRMNKKNGEWREDSYIRIKRMVAIHQWVPAAAPGTAQAAQAWRFLPNTGCYFGRCITRVSGRLCGRLFLACSATVKRTETSGVKPCSCSLNWARPRSRHSIREMLTAQTLNNQPTSLQYLWHIPSLLIASSLHTFTLLLWGRFLF